MKRRKMLYTTAVLCVGGVVAGRLPFDVPPKVWADGTHDDADALQWEIDRARTGGPEVRYDNKMFRLSHGLRFYTDSLSLVLFTNNVFHLTSKGIVFKQWTPWFGVNI